MLTHERLSELLQYDPNTGVFSWCLNRRGFARAGDAAGTVHPVSGYQYIALDGKKYAAHRLAFFYMTRTWPTGEVDHKNRQRADNRWSNLREADRSQNKANTAIRCDNASGYKGVSWDRRKEKWRAGIQLHSRHRHLGYFDNPQAAHAAYTAAAQATFGEYARAM